MVEIPMQAARDAWTELAATNGGRDAEEMVIHRAILAERQRCADVARKEGDGYKAAGIPQSAMGAYTASRAILAA